MFTGNIYYRGNKTAAEDVLHEATQLANKSVAKKEYLGAPNFREQFVLSSGATLDVVINEHQQFMTIVGFGGGAVEEFKEEEFEEEREVLYIVRPKQYYPQVLIRKEVVDGDARVYLEWADNLRAGELSTQPSKEEQISVASLYTNNLRNREPIDGTGAYALLGRHIYLNGFTLHENTSLEGPIAGAAIATDDEGRRRFVMCQVIKNGVDDYQLDFYYYPAFEVDIAATDTDTPLIDDRDAWTYGGNLPLKLKDDPLNHTVCNFSEDGMKASFGFLQDVEDFAIQDGGGTDQYNYQHILEIEFYSDDDDFYPKTIGANGTIETETEPYLNQVETHHDYVGEVPYSQTTVYHGSLNCLGRSQTVTQNYIQNKWVPEAGGPYRVGEYEQELPYVAGLNMSTDGVIQKLEIQQVRDLYEKGWEYQTTIESIPYYTKPYSLDLYFLTVNWSAADANYQSTLGKIPNEVMGNTYTLSQGTKYEFEFNPDVDPDVGSFTFSTLDDQSSAANLSGAKDSRLEYTYSITTRTGGDCPGTYSQLTSLNNYTVPKDEGSVISDTATRAVSEVQLINYSLRQKYFLKYNRNRPYLDNTATRISAFPQFEWALTGPDYTFKEDVYYSFQGVDFEEDIPTMPAYRGDFDREYDCLASGPLQYGGIIADVTLEEQRAVQENTDRASSVTSGFIPHGRGYCLFSFNNYYQQSLRDSWAYLGDLNYSLPLTVALVMYDEKEGKLWDILELYNKLLEDTPQLAHLNQIDSSLATKQDERKYYMYESGITGAKIPEPTINFSDY